MNARSCSPLGVRIGRSPDPREMSPEEFQGVRDLVENNVLALLDSLHGSC
jgi:hypothetical protein